MIVQNMSDYIMALNQMQAARTAIFDFDEAGRNYLTEVATRERVSVKQQLADILMRGFAVKGFTREHGTEYRINPMLREDFASAVKALMLVSGSEDVFSVKADASGAGTLYLIGIDVMATKPGKSVELVMDDGGTKSFFVQTEKGYHYFRTLGSPM